MRLAISENLRQSFLEAKMKKIISIKELSQLQTQIFRDKKWIVYGDYFIDFLMTFGICLIINFLANRLKIDINFITLLIIAEIVFRIYKLTAYISNLRHLYRLLKEDGIEVSEIENFRQFITNDTFRIYKILKLTELIYSPKTQKEIFEPIVVDWQEEYFEALSKKEIWKAHWINVRYTYAFLAAMWMKSPIGDLIEFIRKFAK